MDAVIPPAPSLEEAGDQRRQGAPSAPRPDVPGLEILEAAGGGARGFVYRAAGGRRTVAVKVLRRGVSVDRAALERLLRGPAAPGEPARIRHPAIAPIEAIGETADGSLYYVMPFLRGDPLERAIADLKRGSSDRPSLGPFAIGPHGETHPQLAYRAAEVFAEVAEGLALAHREGIVHRRLHPRNLIFSPAGRLVMTDFGGSASTAGGDALAYVAPEELAPFPEDVGPAADVYSLGVMLYEILSRRLPFAAESPQELKRAILKGRCPVPRSSRSDVPAGLEAAVLKAMAADPRERYADAAELAEELRRFLHHEMPVAFLEARSRPRSRAPARGERGPASAVKRPGAMSVRARLAGAALVVLSMAAAAWWAGERLFGTRERGPRTVSMNPATVHPLGRDRSGSETAEALRRDIPGAGGSREAVSRAADRVVRIGGRELALLEEAVERGGNEDAAWLFCFRDLDAAAVLDMAPRPAEAALSPGLRIDIELDAPRDFTARWIRMLARVDPALFLRPSTLRAIVGAGSAWADGTDEAAILERREDLVRELSRALAEIAARSPAGTSGEAIDALASIAREEYLTGARHALSALAEIGAADALLAIARGGDLPPALREAALAFLGEGLAGLVAVDLQGMALSSPEPAIRRRAFAELATASVPAAAAVIARVIDDPELREDALSRLHALEPDAAGAAVELLEHGDPAVRARAAGFLVVSAAAVTEPLALRLLSPRRATREAALAVLVERGDAGGAVGSLAAALGIAPASPVRGSFLEEGLAAARAFTDSLLRGLRACAEHLARAVGSIRVTRL
jgi:hypothetical protein